MAIRCLALLLPILMACGPTGPADAPEPAENVLGVALPASPDAVSDLEATLTGSGGDPDEAPRWRWTLDGAETPWDGPVVPAEALAVGQHWVVTATLGSGARSESVTAETRIDHLGGNVLVLLVDDVGVDKVKLYGARSDVPSTPTIDGLASQGVLFWNAWVQPTCSPTRAALLTGRYPRRTGVGKFIVPSSEEHALDPDEVIIPEMLAAAPVPWADSGVGKWHLTGFPGNPDPARDPLAAGFSWYAGTLGNPVNSLHSNGRKGYRHWEKATNGEVAFVDDYLTTVTTDDALARIAEMPEPWFLYVAYNAAHAPRHVPPAHLHGRALDPDTATEVEKFDAMVEALDVEMGRLLDGMSSELRSRTTVIFLSDNGTPNDVVVHPPAGHRSKGSLYEGGVHVPMIVTGPAVTRPGSGTRAMVESVDLLPTVAEIAGVDLEDVIDPRTGKPVRLDGVSFLAHVVDPDRPSTRDRAYTSKHFPNGPPPYEETQDALRDGRFKVVWDSRDGYSFYEYAGPFDEGPDLLSRGTLTGEQQEAFDRLSTELRSRMERLRFGP